MSRSGGRLAAIFLLIVGTIVVAAVGYQAGLSAAVASAPTPPTTAPYVAWYHGFVGFPWFFFGPVLFVLFVLLGIWIIRAVAWGGRGGGWGQDHWSDRSARFEEWHRRAHDRMGGTDARSGGDDPGQPGR